MRAKIIQIGAGGTGSWFARTLMHTLAQAITKAVPEDRENLRLTWSIVDPDKVESRNLVRQPFYSGEGQYKSEYLADLVRQFLSYLSVSRDEVYVTSATDMLRHDTVAYANLSRIAVEVSNALRIIVSCVDNTYSRKLMEDLIVANRSDNLFYVNMGVSDDGAWSAERIRSSYMLPKVYAELTYPDEMLSCSQREEIGHVPQTVYSNIMAGATAAQMVQELLSMTSVEQGIGVLYPDSKINPLLRVYGDAWKASVLTKEEYYAERAGGQ